MTDGEIPDLLYFFVRQDGLRTFDEWQSLEFIGYFSKEFRITAYALTLPSLERHYHVLG